MTNDTNPADTDPGRTSVSPEIPVERAPSAPPSVPAPDPVTEPDHVTGEEELDEEIAETFPSSDPPSSWAG